MTHSGTPIGRSGPLRQTDFGFFGPGSPTWRVWTAPTAVIGFQRAVVLEHFDPFLTAAVADSGGIYRDPHGRLDRTLAYFLTVAVADGRTAIGAAEFLMAVHAQATGVEPITGKRYSACNPESQRWIHITGWHSVLTCFERYGPGPLSAEGEARYWADCAVAAELQTCRPADIPRSREEVHAYFAEMRPRLCTSERATTAMHYLLRTPYRNGHLRLWAGSRVLARASIATLPKWMRRLGGFDQPGTVDAALVPAVRAVTRVAGAGAVTLAVLRQIAPTTAGIMAQHLTAGPPEYAGTTTPARARDLYGHSGATHNAAVPDARAERTPS